MKKMSALYKKDILPRKMKISENTIHVESQLIECKEFESIQFHFSKISLPNEAYIEIITINTNEVHLYGKNDLRFFNGVYSLTTKIMNSNSIRINIIYPYSSMPSSSDEVFLSHISGFLVSNDQFTKDVVGGKDERVPTICFKSSENDYPYVAGLATAKVYNRVGSGTAWLYGEGNYLLTNEHVIGSEEDLSVVEFNYMADECIDAGVSHNRLQIKCGYFIFKGSVDYVVFSLDKFEYENAKILDIFGGLSIEENQMVIDENIFIPQHSGGYPQVVSYKKHDAQCKLLNASKDAYVYNCDTGDGASGSPVISDRLQKVVGIHKAKYDIDANQGIPSSFILDEINEHISDVNNKSISGSGQLLVENIAFTAADFNKEVVSFNGNTVLEELSGSMEHNENYTNMIVQSQNISNGVVTDAMYRVSQVINGISYNLEDHVFAQEKKQLLVSYYGTDNPKADIGSAYSAWIGLKIKDSITKKLTNNILLPITNQFHLYDPFTSPFDESTAKILNLKISGDLHSRTSLVHVLPTFSAFIAAYPGQGPIEVLLTQSGYSKISVPIRNSDGEIVTINLRGYRSENGSLWTMNSATLGSENTETEFFIEYNTEDNKTRTLTEYEGIFPIYIKSIFGDLYSPNILLKINHS
ncbi:trypsin-like serine peptidase [Hafnia alvei]|uniref:Serine protease n=1 Tax=Hafnia alvei TaxID=569 RepID=A0ABD7Q9B9_HAFAL|nr:serine protease [Hafnia alvei]TBL69351.1 serine protease [Hafnia alvei]